MFRRAHLGPLALLTLLTTGAGVALAQAPTLSAPPIVGRWDLTVHGARGDYPSWLEVWTSGNEHLVGQFVGSGGSWIAFVQQNRRFGDRETPMICLAKVVDAHASYVRTDRSIPGRLGNPDVVVLLRGLAGSAEIVDRLFELGE